MILRAGRSSIKTYCHTIKDYQNSRVIKSESYYLFSQTKMRSHGEFNIIYYLCEH
jgi:hypothetical protein